MPSDRAPKPDREGEASPILAAGALVWRFGDDGIEVCAVHRPKRDDWTIPKGKLEAGEHILTCAVREVAEETGHRVILGRPMPHVHYEVNGKPKTVFYWAAEADENAPVRPADSEVDDVRFLPADAALTALTYENDRRLVAQLLEDGHDGPATSPILIVRHANAVPRSEWRGEDNDRPLDSAGREQAAKLVPLLDALGVQACVSSPADRCVDTVRPWANHRHTPIDLDPSLSESAFSLEGVANVAKRLRNVPTVFCTHRPVLPHLLSEFGVNERNVLRVGEFVVAHLRDGRVIATERHCA